MPGAHRTERVGDLIRAEVVEIIRRRVKDPRVGTVTVTAVEVSADLRHAKVFVSLLPTGQGAEAPAVDLDRTLAALDRASGFIRGELGRHLRMRVTPALSFHPDGTLDQAERIQQLLDQTRPGTETRPETRTGP